MVPTKDGSGTAAVEHLPRLAYAENVSVWRTALGSAPVGGGRFGATRCSGRVFHAPARSDDGAGLRGHVQLSELQSPSVPQTWCLSQCGQRVRMVRLLVQARNSPSTCTAPGHAGPTTGEIYQMFAPWPERLGLA